MKNRQIKAMLLGLLFTINTALSACQNIAFSNTDQQNDVLQDALEASTEEMIIAINVDGAEEELPFGNVWMNRSRLWGSLVFGGLMIAEENINNVQTDLCQEYAISPDGLNYVFSLREDVVWHDGKKFTAEDVRWTIETFLKLQQTNGFIQSGLQEIVGVEEFINGETNTLQGIQIEGMDITIKLAQKNDSFLASIAQLAILPKHCFEDVAIEAIPESDFWMLPVGTGPYKVVSNQDNQEAVLVINEDYNGKKPLIRQIRYKVVDPKEPGDFDLTLTSDPHTISKYQNNPAYEVVMTNNLYYRYLFFNLDCRTGANEGLLKDERVRQALMLGLDRNTIINNIYKGLAINIDCGIPEYDSWYVKKDPELTEYRPAQARELLEQAGFDFNTTLILTRYSSDELSIRLLEEIARCWNAIGVKTEIIPISSTDTGKMFVNADWYDIGLKNLAAVNYGEWYYEYSSANSLWSIIMGEHKGFDTLIDSLDNSKWAYEKEMLYGEIQKLETKLVYKIPLAIVPQYVIYNKEKIFIPSMEFPNMWFYYNLNLSQWKIVDKKPEEQR